MMNKYYESHDLDKKVLFYFGLATFIYALSVAGFIQLYVIPILFPHFDLGDGLAVLDSVGFHELAKFKALEIIETGWQAWELHPQIQAPSGIASAFYAIWVPKPYSMLPFNAMLHALSGCLVVSILNNFYSCKPAVLGGALFVLNPSALEWVAQLHRDGIFILGNLMVVTCLIQFSKYLDFGKLSNVTLGLFWGVTGTVVVWVARPFWIEVLMLSISAWMLALILFSSSKGVRTNEH